MVKRLQYKFILISSFAVSAVIVFLLILLNQMFYRTSLSDVDHALHYISSQDGEIPDDLSKSNLRGYGSSNQIHCFTVRVSHGVVSVKKKNVNITEKQAIKIGSHIIDKKKKQGQITENNKPYYYLYTQKDSQKLIVFLDCYKELYDIYKLRRYSVFLGTFCIFFFVIIVSLLSRTAVKPVIQNIESQKEFIANASHELKTPLSIISANTEYLEIIHGKDEWIESILHQVDRLNGLISHMITLTRLGEIKDLPFSDFNVSQWLLKNMPDFQKLMDKKSLKLESHIEDDITVHGVVEHIKELITILIDNAIKYCDENGSIRIELFKKQPGNNITFAVSNTYQSGKNINYARFFERFYRGEQSHNNKIEGYGIGLAMAKGFAKESKCKISVDYKEDTIVFTVKF